MDQCHALGAVCAVLDEGHRTVQRGVVLAHDHQTLAGEIRRVAHAVKELRAFKRFQALELERARQEGAHAGGDEDRPGEKGLAPGCAHEKAAIVPLLDLADQLLEVERGVKRRNLLEQPVGEFAPGADLDRRDVVDRLVRVQLDALAASPGKGIDDMGLDAQQAQLEHLEQADRARADDERIGLQWRGIGLHRERRAGRGWISAA